MPLGFPRPSLRKKKKKLFQSFFLYVISSFVPSLQLFLYVNKDAFLNRKIPKKKKKKDGVLMLISNAMQVKRLPGKAESTFGGLKKRLQPPRLSGRASWVQTEERERESFACYCGGSRNSSRLSLMFSGGGGGRKHPASSVWLVSKLEMWADAAFPFPPCLFSHCK